MQIVWDERKRQVNLIKHGLDFADLSFGFFETAIIEPARLGRFRAFAHLDDLAVSVVFRPLRREAIALISLRRAGSREMERFDDRI